MDASEHPMARYGHPYKLDDPAWLENTLDELREHRKISIQKIRAIKSTSRIFTAATCLLEHHKIELQFLQNQLGRACRSKPPRRCDHQVACSIWNEAQAICEELERIETEEEEGW